MRATTASSVTTDFLYDGDSLVAEYSGAGALLRRYVHGPGINEPIVWYEGSGLTDRRYHVSDHLGSVIAEDGSSVAINQYGPYGEPQAWTGGRFRYTGQVALPEVGLYHYRARVYDPVLGRFLQTDPIGYDDDLNLYAYVRNDPNNGYDPTGMCSEDGDFGKGGVHCIVTGANAPTAAEIGGLPVLSGVGDAYSHWFGGSRADAAIDITSFGSDAVGDFEDAIGESALGRLSGTVEGAIRQAQESGEPVPLSLRMETEARGAAFPVIGRAMASLEGALAVDPTGSRYAIVGTVRLESERFDFNSDPARGAAANAGAAAGRWVESQTGARPYNARYVGSFDVRIVGPVPWRR